MNLSTLEPNEQFFYDRKRKIDYVLVLKEEQDIEYNESSYDDTDTQRLVLENASGRDKHEQLEVWRQNYLGEIKKKGLEVEEHYDELLNYPFKFIKIHGTFSTLRRYAEDLEIEVPLQKVPEKEGFNDLLSIPDHLLSIPEKILSILRIPNIMHLDIPYPLKTYYTTPFRDNNFKKYLGHENEAAFFSSSQRSAMVYEILSKTAYGNEKAGEIGIDGLVANGGFYAVYPLHDGPYEDFIKDEMTTNLSEEIHDDQIQNNERKILYEYWAKWRRWYKYQPLHRIRNYFGEKVAIYFAWIGMYTSCLVPAMFFGLIVLCYGLSTLSTDSIIMDLCDETKNITLCPICDNCPIEKLSSRCDTLKTGYIFSNWMTLIYTVFMSLWTVSFLVLWKRKAATLANDWGCVDLAEVETLRPEFCVKAPHKKVNKVTGKEEPSFSRAVRCKRMAIGYGIILMMAIVVVIVLISIGVYRVFVLSQMDHSHPTFASTIATITGALLQIICITILNELYERLARSLTIWEMHRTQSEHDNSLASKIFLFQFLNYYSSIFYIAFFKGKFVGYPGNYHSMFSNYVRAEACSPGGCQADLMIQMAFIFIGDQLIEIALEFWIPKIKIWCHKRGMNILSPRNSQMDRDLKLAEHEGLLYEYLKVTLQFCSVTIFVSAFPLAPFFALINNWVEVRLDAQKLLCDSRRVRAERANDIGIWFPILQLVAKFSVILNAFHIAFTSDLVERYYYEWNKMAIDQDYSSWILSPSPKNYTGTPCFYAQFRDTDGKLTMTYWEVLAMKLIFIVVFEHFVFAFAKLVDFLLPDMPKHLQIKLKRQKYLCRQKRWS